ncbi:MAG: S24/S26 family peptidase, partial [Acidobacteriales bacterium]|nr:S24/S26 family peptidase [Terriglobales bacterium]
MLPAIRDGEILYVEPTHPSQLRKGEIALFNQGSQYRAHRLIAHHQDTNMYMFRGDSSAGLDGMVKPEQVLGKIVAKEESHTGKTRLVRLSGKRARLHYLAVEARRRAR